jgi:hypothetical protein
MIFDSFTIIHKDWHVANSPVNDILGLSWGASHRQKSIYKQTWFPMVIYWENDLFISKYLKINKSYDLNGL